MKQLLEDDALTNGTSAVSGQAKEGITTPTPVPMNASLGSGGFDGGGGEVPPPLMPPGGPPPPIPSGGSEDFIPEPPPPPPEPNMEPAPPID
ncbi:MAG: hypothetical protein NTV34_13675 [Proteobacteria bacterium]|nr:hypothetical protein [Pseudomonadota bacterium]